MTLHDYTNWGRGVKLGYGISVLANFKIDKSSLQLNSRTMSLDISLEDLGSGIWHKGTYIIYGSFNLGKGDKAYWKSTVSSLYINITGLGPL